ncbi:MAG: hypothetical protein ACFB0C_17080 [Leptolyngbyaceae cyanobacterium]
MERRRRCDRNRKRSKRRAIYCPEHGCYLDSASQKHRLYAESPQHLKERGVGRRTALLLFATATTVPLDGEWLECFWCDQCQETNWYHVRKVGDREYQLSPAPRELWQQATGVITTNGNPTVSAFTRRHARATNFNGIKDFNFLR